MIVKNFSPYLRFSGFHDCFLFLLEYSFGTNRDLANNALYNTSHFIMREPPPVVPVEGKHEQVVVLVGGFQGSDR